MGDNIIYKDKHILEKRNMEETMSDIKLGKGINTMNVKKFQKTTKFERLIYLMCLVVLSPLFFRCAVNVAGTSILSTRPSENWKMCDEYNFIIKGLLCVCLFSNAAAFLYCAVLEGCRLLGRSVETPLRSSFFLLSFGVGFLCYIISERLVKEQQTIQASNLYLAFYSFLGVLLNMVVMKIIVDGDDVESNELNKIKIKKTGMNKEVSLLEF